jgi:hypothetical protein
MRGLLFAVLAAVAPGLQAIDAALAQTPEISQKIHAVADRTHRPPRAAAAERFLAERGWTSARGVAAKSAQLKGTRALVNSVGIEAGTAATATWQSLGPTAVSTSAFGLVTGRVTALALDPADATGNRLYLGTTGGGVWVAQNAGTSNASTVVFTPLTDTLAALGGAADASISIGALTVQPGGTGVILAGTGDPNDVLDSYYGAGILRSTDGGSSWTLVTRTNDAEQGLGARDFSFVGEGFAGFAWSTVSPQIVVAAVSQAYEGAVVNATQPSNSYQGLYYSADSGATWHLALISDGSGNSVQGPLASFAQPDGNAATSVVWNPVRRLFIAAVRFHGYYQSPDGATWTRMTAQPGTGLIAKACPTNGGTTGSIACPIYRGTLAVNPSSGDTFAWTVDVDEQDQGLWQDPCAIATGSCANETMTFSRQWSTAALETNTSYGAATIADGSYTLALAAPPAGLGAGQDTILFAGADDLWRCSLAMGCVWRNTTNTSTCKTAQVGEFQHALAWSTANPLEIFIGNDSGLWRSMDAVGESGQVCSTSDATHFQNLNANLGSLAEVVSLSGFSSPYTMMAGLGVNGTAGVKASVSTAEWPQVLGGYGGPVAIDFSNNSNWYVNSQAGVAIYRCSQSAPCTADDFGTSPVIGDADVGGDGATMPTPAPFLVDPLDSAQLLVGTCRVWRGAASGGWSASNAISAVLDTGGTASGCSGDSLVRSMAALALPGGSERVYVGMYGAATVGGNLAGHVLSAVVNTVSGAAPVWTDLTFGRVTNDSNNLNKFGMDISSVFIDPHDATANTVYVTVEGMQNSAEDVLVVYRTTDGGSHWTSLTSNLPDTPASGIAVDPQDANTVYLATDEGVYFTTKIASCGLGASNCWSVFGSGLPSAPVVAIGTTPAGAPQPVLAAATYGRGIWMTPLWTAGTSLTSVVADPSSLTFANQVFGTKSSAQTVTLENTGTIALAVTSFAMSGDFSETDNCVGASIAAGSSCAIQVTFTPSATGARTGQMTVNANVYGGDLTVDLSGTGDPAGTVSMDPSSIDFGKVQVGSTSTALQVSVNNSGSTVVPINSVTITAPFKITSNSCGTTSLAAETSCQVLVQFAPVQAGAVAGLLTFTDGAGTQTVTLSGTGAAVATDLLNPLSLSFSGTGLGARSAAQTILLTNIGDEPLTAISISVSGAFQTSNNCGTQLSGPAACTISVFFAPAQLGSQSGTLTVYDALRTQTVSLTGIGLQPAVLSASPSSLTFSSQQIGVPSTPQTVTVSNTGGAAMDNVGFQLTGAAAASYSLGTTTCGATLAAGASCTVPVVFTPSSTGVVAASLVVSSSTLGVTPVSVALNGGGQVSSGLVSNPTQVIFATVGVGLSSAASTVTLTNSSGYAIASLSLAASGPFAVAQNTCAGGLAIGANCSAAIVFQPVVSGVASGALTIGSSSLANPTSVALSGVGFDFTTTVSGTSSMTVSAGQTASYTVSIKPLNSAQGTFTYVCGTLPANALCTFNPSSTTVSAGATGSVTVQISTGKASTALTERPGDWHALPMLCGLVLLPVALLRGRRRLLLVLLAVLVAGGVSSCTSSGGGSSSGGSGSGSATPPGTYTIPVTVSSTGISHAATVTLTVD